MHLDELYIIHKLHIGDMFYQTIFKKASSAEDQWLNKVITYSQATDNLNKDSIPRAKPPYKLGTKKSNK